VSLQLKRGTLKTSLQERELLLVKYLNSISFPFPRMHIRIIPPALKKATDRGISKQMIIGAVRFPDQSVNGYGDRIVKQKKIVVDNKDKLLRVVCEIERDEVVVVTAYLTSNIGKYWRQ